jgi:Spy/CpxP family protein refolding chaperone
MKSSPVQRFLAPVAAAAALTFVGLPAQAQPSKPQPSKPTKPSVKKSKQPKKAKAKKGKLGKRAKKLRDRLLRKRLGLDEAKAKKVEAILRDFMDQRRAANRKMREARRKLRELFEKDSDDQKAYKAAIATFRAARKELHQVQERQFDALAKELNPKQQAVLTRELMKMRRRMNRARRGGGKGKRGRGGSKGPEKFSASAQKRRLMAKVAGGSASQTELRMLKAICMNDGDRACRDMVIAEIHRQKSKGR